MKHKNNRSPTAASRAASSAVSACEFCTQAGGAELWRDARCRIVMIKDADYPGFCRVIWNTHVREMTDLPVADQRHCMRVVLAVETALRKVVNAHKVNLASLGNMTPHLHWHVIPRFELDAHFPNPVWGERRQPQRATPRRTPRLGERLTVELLNLIGNGNLTRRT